MDTESNLGEAIDLLIKQGKQTAEVRKTGVFEYAILPNDCTVVDLTAKIEPYRESPRRKVANVTLRDVAAFVHYFKMHVRPESTIFGSDKDVTFSAIFDYHGAGTDTPAGWREHRASFKLVSTPEWNIWAGKSGVKMTQVDFAQFIEDNSPDISDPPAAEMVEIARNLEATQSAVFSSAIRLNNGQQQFKWDEQIDAKSGNFKIPEEFTVKLIPFVGTGVIAIEARLRFRINQGKLTMWYDLVRPHKVVEEAFLDAKRRIEEECGTTIMLGSAG